MSRVLILGYGNSLRGDDALGPLAADRLRGLLPDPEIEIRALHQLTPEWIEPIARAGRVIFIDAAAGANPGEVMERPITPNPAAGAFTHHATPESLLTGAQALYGAAPPALLVTVTAASFDWGEQLSEPVQKALEQVTRIVACISVKKV